MSGYSQQVSEALNANAKGHVWKTDDDTGLVDYMAWASGHHNGPVCVTCGFEFCHHCWDNIPPQECQGKQDPSG